MSSKVADADILNEKASTESSSTGSFENISQPGEESAGTNSRRNSVASSKGTMDSEHEEEESTPLEYVEPIPDITEPTEHEILQAKDPFLEPLREEQKQFYSEACTNRAVNTLILFSLMMFSLPFGVMFVMYYYVFQDYFDLPPDQAMLYAGLCGVLCVFVIIGWFIKIAYDEEKEAERLLKLKKED